MESKKPREAAYKDTRDLAFAAYAHMMGLKIKKATQWKRGTSTEYKFSFDDPSTPEYPDGRWETLLFDFANSEATRFDSSVRSLKKLCKPVHN